MIRAISGMQDPQFVPAPMALPTAEVEDFIHGVNALTQLTFARGNSIYFNELRFRDLYENYQTNIEKCRASLTFPE